MEHGLKSETSGFGNCCRVMALSTTHHNATLPTGEAASRKPTDRKRQMAEIAQLA
jgi:hypothetical protein